MKHARESSGFTIVELVVVLLVLAVLLVVAMPSIAGGRGDASLQQSMSNLVTMGLANVVYAADWEGRQVTWCREDVGLYASFGEYNAANNCGGGFDPNCQPPIIAGLGPVGGGGWAIWAYWSTAANAALIAPLNFPGGPYGDSVAGWGHFRMPNPRPFHEYLTGRYHDAIYYAPKDTAVLDGVEACIGALCEFCPEPSDCNPGWSSYCFSPAALFHPDVMRSNAAGGWQNPWGLAQGFEVPGLFQATYPDLKTQMVEHSWLQGPPAECNPAFAGCEPYYFNHGIDSAPAALFYDGSVRLLPNQEVLLADFQVLNQTGGVDGLWHRGTPFGTDGYFISASYDFVPLSHHVLTTDGILGRDTLSGTPAAPLSMTWSPPASNGALGPTPAHATAPVQRDPMRLTAEGGQP